jgi:uncharacterized protein YdiU (UPF0061 family)
VRAAFYGEPAKDAVDEGLSWLQQWRLRARSEARDVEVAAEALNRANPKFVLRNWLAQEAIDAATAGDASKLHRLQRVLARPYDEQSGEDDLAQKRPDWAKDKPGCSALSCSS